MRHLYQRCRCLTLHVECSTGVEPDKDLAVLKIQDPSKNALRPVSVGSSSGLQVRQLVLHLSRFMQVPFVKTWTRN